MITYRSLIMALAAWLAMWSALTVSAQQRGNGREQYRRQGQRNDRPPRNNRGRRPDRRQPGRGDVNRVPGPRESSEFVNWKIGLNLNSQQAWPGYTLFAPKHNLLTYLIDNQGQIINSWVSQYEPGQSVYLLENGHLLHCCFTKGPGGIGGGEGGRLEEFDWEGNLLWEYWCSDETKMMHHDIEPLPNGNILALVVEKKSYDQCIAAGFPPNIMRDNYLLPEYVVEIEKKGKNDANIVWQWHVWDHLIQDNDPQKPNFGNPAEHPERISVEANGRGAAAFWNHMNSITYNTELDQIMLSVRGCSELWIIDHSTTTEEARGSTGGRYGKGGDLLYRWGNPAAYGRGTARDQKLFQQHDAQWIPKGCPGEGNILIFNNGLNRSSSIADRQARGGRLGGGRNRGESYSSVDQIIPPIDEKGNYRLETNKAFGPEEPTWTYSAPNKTDFYAEAISGCQRLPNGNTLICDGTSGIFFEVTADGQKTWKYVCPVDGDGPMEQGDPIPLDHRGHAMNAVFKIHRYALDYPAFKGKDMTPKGKVTGSKPENVPENLSRARRPGGGGAGERGQGRGGQDSQRGGAGGQRGQRRPYGGDSRGRPRQGNSSSSAAANVRISSIVTDHSTAGGFRVSSPVVKQGGPLPVDFTGDGAGSSILVEWSGVPAGVQCFALTLWHTAPDREKSYWIVYNIPAEVRSLPRDAKGIGTFGFNDMNRAEYMPMRSKGSGVKEYNITVYALSTKPKFSTDKVTRSDLLEAISDITLAENTLTYTYERPQAVNSTGRSS